MMHHPDAPVLAPPPYSVVANKNNDNRIDLSKRTPALLQTGLGGGALALNTIQPYRVS